MKLVPRYTKKKKKHKEKNIRKTQTIENIQKYKKNTHHEKHITWCIYSSQLIVCLTQETNRAVLPDHL